jgi:hypothetical protein
VYAFGIILWEVLTREDLYEDKEVLPLSLVSLLSLSCLSLVSLLSLSCLSRVSLLSVDVYAFGIILWEVLTREDLSEDKEVSTAITLFDFCSLLCTLCYVALCSLLAKLSFLFIVVVTLSTLLTRFI